MLEIKVYNDKGLVDLDQLNKEFNQLYKLLANSNLNGEVGCRYVVTINGYKLDYRISLVIRSDKTHNINVDYIPTKSNVVTANEVVSGKVDLPFNYLFIIEEYLNSKLYMH